MKLIRRMRLSIPEVERIREETDDYIWIALDVRRSIMCMGDCYIGELRDALLEKRSRAEDIFCLGLNMATGDINFLRAFNRHNPKVGYFGKIPLEIQETVDRQIRYFFGALPIYDTARKIKRFGYKRLRLAAQEAGI